MYNLYIEEKKRNQSLEKDKYLQMDDKRKNLLNTLNDKYQARVKNFVIEMLSETPQVVVTDFKGPIKNCRENYLEEMNKKIKGRPGFLFGGFKCEKDRIKETIKRNNFLYSGSTPISKEKSRNENVCLDSNDNNLVILPRSHYYYTNSLSKQPALRFKPRTDLERIQETISKSRYNTQDLKKIVSKQLSQLDLNVFHHNDNSEELFGSRVMKKKGSDNEFIIQSAKNMDKKLTRLIKYKRPINADAKMIMPEFHFKTHFKGAESASIAVKRDRETKKHYQTNNLNESNNNSNSFQPVPQLQENKSTKIIKSLINYAKNQNPNKVEKEEENGIKEKMEQLKVMIMQGCNSLPNISRIRDYYEEDKLNRDDEIINIGNESYSIKNQFDIIANKMLNKCNVYHAKNKNNNSCIKARGGKLMMTNGMTVKEFESKYNLSTLNNK